MKLNPDCVRDILLTVEETSNFGDIMSYDTSDEYPLLAKYTYDEFLYHVNQCKENGYFLTCKISSDGSIVMIGNLSPKAHDFLTNIRHNNIWNIVKDVSAKVGSNSLSAVAQIAAGVITEIIKMRIGTLQVLGQ